MSNTHTHTQGDYVKKRTDSFRRVLVVHPSVRGKQQTTERVHRHQRAVSQQHTVIQPQRTPRTHNTQHVLG